MREWFTASEILPAAAPALPDALSALNAYILDAGWRRDVQRARVRFGKGGGYEYHITLLPLSTRAALSAADETIIQKAVAASEGTARSPLWDGFDRLPASAKGRAALRLAAVQAVQAAEHGVTRQAAVAATAIEQGVSCSALWGWLARVEGVPPCDWLPILADQRAGGERKRAVIHPDAWDYFLADYLRLEEPGLEACYDRLKRIAPTHGWGPQPALKTFRRHLDAEVPRAAQVLARKGREASKVMVPAQRRDRTVFASLEAVNADGYRHNVFVKWPDGTIARPISIAFQDIRSGLWLARRTDRSENKEATRLAIGDVVTRHGIMEHVYFDNGRHFSSKWLTGRMPFRFRFKVKDEEPAGILTTLGVKVHFTTPYSGRSKPIERMFRQVGEYVDKHPAFAGAYTGKDPLSKPENYGSAAVPLELFEQVCASELAAHNAREGRSGYGMHGRSFTQVFADHAPELGFRRASTEQRRLFMLAAEGVTARKPDGRIELFDNRFWCEELAERVGQKLIVRFDPQNLSEGVALYTLDNRYIAEAQRLDDVGFNSVDDAREAARLQHQIHKSRQQLLDLSVKLDEADLKRLAPVDLTDHDRPEPQRVQRLVANGAPRQAAAASLDFDAIGSALDRIQHAERTGRGMSGVIPFRNANRTDP
jgi:putative transposase